VLENLEALFYKQAIAKFQPSDFAAAGFQSTQLVQEQLTNIQQDEATHVTFLQVSTFREPVVVWRSLSCSASERSCVVRSAAGFRYLQV
jgi:hypothetical protein